MSDAAAEVAAYVTLRRLQNRYADIVTRRAWAELVEIVRADCEILIDLHHNQFELTGPQELGEFIGRAVERFDLFHFVVLNTVIEVDVTAGTAGARFYIQEIRQNVSDGRRTDAFGLYHDRFERDNDGRWWFARRLYRTLARSAEAGSDTDYDVFNPPLIALGDL